MIWENNISDTLPHYLCTVIKNCHLYKLVTVDLVISKSLYLL